jgi:hypothetical protein
VGEKEAGAKMKPRAIRIDKCPRCGVVLRERSLEKNAHLHAVLSQIAAQRQWAGKWLDVEAWKRLMVAAFEREKGHSAELYPALDGQGMDIVYRRTSLMSQEEIRELIHFAEAWAIDNGVDIRRPDEAAA